MSRIWRLDVGENVLEIGKELEYHFDMRKNSLVPVRGRILQNTEIVENINVAENDVLLYEVQSMQNASNNNFFVLIPKENVQKQQSKRLQKVMKAKGLDEKQVTEEQLMQIPLTEVIDTRSCRAGKTGL